MDTSSKQDECPSVKQEETLQENLNPTSSCSSSPNASNSMSYSIEPSPISSNLNILNTVSANTKNSSKNLELDLSQPFPEFIIKDLDSGATLTPDELNSLPPPTPLSRHTPSTTSRLSMSSDWDDSDFLPSPFTSKSNKNDPPKVRPISKSQKINSLQNVFTEQQKIAYVGLVHLASVWVLNERLKGLDHAKKEYEKWIGRTMDRLYLYLEVSEDEKKMIRTLSEHGLLAKDLSSSLIADAKKTAKAAAEVEKAALQTMSIIPHENDVPSSLCSSSSFNSSSHPIHPLSTIEGENTRNDENLDDLISISRRESAVESTISHVTLNDIPHDIPPDVSHDISHEMTSEGTGPSIYDSAEEEINPQEKIIIPTTTTTTITTTSSSSNNNNNNNSKSPSDLSSSPSDMPIIPKEDERDESSMNSTIPITSAPTALPSIPSESISNPTNTTTTTSTTSTTTTTTTTNNNNNEITPIPLPPPDIRHTILSHFFLLSLLDGQYDARSRNLMRILAQHLEMTWSEVIQLEKMVADQLRMYEELRELKSGGGEVESRRLKDQKKRWLYLGLATLGKSIILLIFFSLPFFLA